MMKMIGITGSRLTSDDVERDVRAFVQEHMAAGATIVAGGAPGVDFIATDEALKQDPTAGRVIVVLPTPLETYRRLYDRRVVVGKATREETDELFGQLDHIMSVRAAAIVELNADELTTDSFQARNDRIVMLSDEVGAFCVNNSPGTTYTLTMAKRQGKPVTTHEYEIF